MRLVLAALLAFCVAGGLSAQINESWQDVPELQFGTGGPVQLVPAGNDIFALYSLHSVSGVGRIRGRMFSTSAGNWIAKPALGAATNAPQVAPPQSDNILGHVAVWTGNELVVRGLSGNSPAGGIYDPTTDSWSNPTNLNASLGAGLGAVALWTGNRVFIYGGAGSTWGGSYDPSTDTWDTRPGLASGGPPLSGGGSVVWTGSQVIVWGGDGSAGTTGGVYDYATDAWLSKPSLTNNTGGPAWIDGARAVWSGSRLIIWGGPARAGIYNPATDTWESVAGLTGTGQPASSNQNSVITWTGTRLLVWSGSATLQTGALFDPGSNSWVAASNLNSATNAPPGRERARVAVLNGQVWVFSGIRNNPQPNVYDNTGGTYHVVSDTWLNVSEWERGFGAPQDMLGPGHRAVSDGTNWIFWGGEDNAGAYTNKGAVFNRTTDRWEYPANLAAGTGAPTPRSLFGICWTGSHVMIIGGKNSSDQVQNSGRLYDPVTDTWSAPAALSPAPTHTVGTVTEALTVGTHVYVLADRTGWSNVRGGIYDTTTDTWLNTPNLASGIGGPTFLDGGMFWTGAYLFVWQDNAQESLFYDPGQDRWFSHSALSQTDPVVLPRPVGGLNGESLLMWGGHSGRDGAYYNRRTDRFVHRENLSTGSNAPDAQYDFAGAWTGDRLVAWGGRTGSNQTLNEGGVYDSVADRWTATPTGTNCPSARSMHSGVWTGSRFIVWGGQQASTWHDNGAILDPNGPNWELRSNLQNGVGAPTGRAQHGAVWTGQAMLVWGGNDGGNYLNNGGLYDPATDTWLNRSNLGNGTGAPTPRVRPAVVWTGSRALVWGGTDSAGPFNTGGAYDPTTDAWLSTPNLGNGTGAPSPRSYHGAVWTGTHLFVWGGYTTGSTPDNTGGMYNPATDSWENLPNLNNGTGAPSAAPHPLVLWDGGNIIVYNDSAGGVYNPATDTWTLPAGMTAAATAPDIPDSATVSASDGFVHFWGGNVGTNLTNAGYLLDIERDQWVNAPNLNAGTGAPAPGAFAHSFWTGEYFVVWTPYLDNGGAYNPATDTWENVPNLASGNGDPNYPNGSGLTMWSGTELLAHTHTGTTLIGGVYRIDTPTPTTAPEIQVRREDGWHLQHNDTDVLFQTLSALQVDYRIINTGHGTLNITSAVVSNPVNCSPVVITSPVSAVPGFGAHVVMSIDVGAGTSGAFQFDVEITSDDSDEPLFIFTVQGDAPPPQPEIDLEDASSNPVPWGSISSLGSQPAQVAVSLDYSILNTGAGNLAVGSVSFSNAVNCSGVVTLAPGSSVAASTSTPFTIEITPVYSGTFSIAVSIPNSDANENPYQFTLTGTGTGTPEIDVREFAGPSVPSGSSISLTGASQGLTSSLLLEVHNLGTTDLLLATVDILNQSACTATVTTMPISPLQGPTGMSLLELEVLPTAIGAFGFTIRIVNSDSDEGQYVVQVDGNAAGGSAGIQVERASSLVASGSIDPVGGIPSTSASTFQYDITNIGTSDLAVGAVAATGVSNCSANVITQPATTISPSTSSLFEITVQPGTGTFSADFSFTTNVPGLNTFVFTISGTGSALPDLEVSRMSVPVPSGTTDVIADVAVGSSEALDYTLTNIGGSDVLLTGTPIVQLVLTNCGVSFQSVPGASISAAGSETLRIVVTPATKGPFSVVVTIPCTDPVDSPYVFTIAGTATSDSGGGGEDSDSNCSTSSQPSGLFVLLLMAVATHWGLRLRTARLRSDASAAR